MHPHAAGWHDQCRIAFHRAPLSASSAALAGVSLRARTPVCSHSGTGHPTIDDSRPAPGHLPAVQRVRKSQQPSWRSTERLRLRLSACLPVCLPPDSNPTKGPVGCTRTHSWYSTRRPLYLWPTIRNLSFDFSDSDRGGKLPLCRLAKHESAVRL